MTLDAASLLFHLRAVGIVMAVLVVVNLIVPAQFHWREELSGVSLLNRQIFQLHMMFIILLLALLSALFLTSADALLEPTRSSRALLIGLTAFWGARMVMQWCFSPAIWRGDRFRTAVHGVFSLTWIYVTSVCAAALWFTLRG